MFNHDDQNKSRRRLRLVCFGGPARAQIYVWQRSLETVTAHSEAHWALQGIPDEAEDPETGPDVGLDGFAASELTGAGDTQIVFGGNGGNGGGGAANFMGGANGAAGAGGDNATGTDGAVGPSPRAQGGAGGQAGADGEATADISTNGIVELNPDGQAVLSWSWIHNQQAELLLRGAGGGGGGGGGGGAFIGLNGLLWGGRGGSGGSGQRARGWLSCAQTSTADVIAALDYGPDADGNTPGTTTARVVIDLGWTSTGAETGAEEFNVPDAPWNRNANITIVMGNPTRHATLTISGGPIGPIRAQGTFADGRTFDKWGVDSLEDATGSFGIGLSEFPVTLYVGDEVSIFADGADVSSTLRIRDANPLNFDMDAPGGGGGGGGAGGGDAGGGIDGADIGNALGAGGDDGGAGGLGFQGTPDGHPGGGGAGHENDTQRNGLFDGVVEIHLDQ